MFASVYLVQHFDLIMAGFENRHFTMVERLLTEARIIWLYIQMILIPVPSSFGLFLDDIVLSTSIITPITTLFAILGIFCILITALVTLKRFPILSFGLLFFLAGHLIESTFLPLELAFEHRNYLPSIGLLLPLFFYLGTTTSEKLKNIMVIAMVVIIVLYSLLTLMRSVTWSDRTSLFLTTVHHHPDSPRANYEAGKIYGQLLERRIGNPELNYREAMKYFSRVTELRNNTTSGLFGSIIASIDSNHNIDHEWIDELAYRLANQPLEQVNIHWLDKMSECVSNGKCDAEEIQIPRLLEAAIDYPKANNRNKSILYAVMAKYQYRVEKNYDSAIDAARKSVALMPSNLNNHYNLVQYLVWANKYDEAEEALKIFARRDKNGQYRNEIFRLRTILGSNSNHAQ
jgi:tetratricopeptide (TPR) repeat protein